ncbi:TVP38/TMEM64 family protein [Corynebacterium sp. LK2510]|uniref:TVP38/TMEM64 family protein n=1 Tax=Corynebacterium sp. LK2510 TaxID=3110472 RepID=UPI0034CD7582
MPKISVPRALALCVVAVVFFVVWRIVDVPPLAVLRDWADNTGPIFPVLFWMLYVLITQFPVPRTVMTLSSGILFGPVAGLAIALTATTAAAVVSLSVVRGLLRDWITPRLTHPSVEMINRRLEERGWLAVASLRMIAVVPFSVMNYAAALSRVRVAPFAIATFAGSMPGTLGTVFFGDTLTGRADPAVIALTATLAAIGIAGLLLDASLPTRQGVASKVPTIDR